MNSFKEMYKKLTYIIFVSMVFLLIANVVYLLSISNKYASDFFDSETKLIHSDLKLTIDSLKKTCQVVSQNKDIIDVLKNNKSIEEISPDEKSLVLNEIALSEGYLHNLTFVDTINIVSYSGNYLLANENLYDNFYTNDRPWFNESMLDNKYDPILVPTHKDFTTGKYTTSIVSFILDDFDEILGVTILDIYVDDLLEYIESKYYLGDLYAHVLIDDVYYPPIDRISNISYYNTNLYDISLYFDKTSSTFFTSNILFLKYSILFYILVFLFIMTLILIYTKKLFKPIINSLNKFKWILNTSDKDIVDFNNKGELEQLELLSGVVSKSFDDKIHQLIYYDDFTSLPNRKSLIKITNDFIKNSTPFALILVDVSNLKTLIDLFGSGFGDTVIKEFSDILSLSIVDDVIITKYSYSKFVIIYPDYNFNINLDDFYKKYILDVFKDKTWINNTTTLQLSASVSIYPNEGDTLDKLLRKNEFMIDISKRNSLYSSLLYFNGDVYDEVSRIESIKHNLKTAISNNEFKVFYQPIVDKNKSIKKLEALIRWENKSLGNISPVEFIQYAEETGDIVDIGYWIFEDVCKNYDKIKSISENPIQVSINVSPIQLLDSSFCNNVADIINRYKVDLDSICIEITESTLIENNDIIDQNINGLSSLGILIALDDFGTGYSSFAYLKQFNFSVLKLDKIFIDEASESDYKIINYIKNIAKELDMDVVMEGVETKDQFDNLLDMDFDYFQGYYFSKPLPLDDLI